MNPCYKEWTVVFPGKMAISWKRLQEFVGTEEEARAEAAKWGNVVVVPLVLWQKMKENEHRMVAAEQKLEELGFRSEYKDGQPVFTEFSKVQLPEYLEGKGE